MRQRLLHFLMQERRPSTDLLAEEEIAALVKALSDPPVTLTERESRILKAASGLSDDDLRAILGSLATQRTASPGA